MCVGYDVERQQHQSRHRSEQEIKYGTQSALQPSQSSEVSVIIPGDLEDHLNVVLHEKSGGLQIINELHRSYDPLHYVLMFPYGEDGFHLGIPHTKRTTKNITVTEYARFRLQIRSGSFNQVMKLRR